MIRTTNTYKRLLISSENNVIKLDSLKRLFPYLENLVIYKIKKESLKNDLAQNESDEMKLYQSFKFGVVLVKDNQDEDEIFNNNGDSPDWEEFLDFLGEKNSFKKSYKIFWWS